jgi:hypothetical protein
MRNIMRIATSSLVLTGGLGLAGLGAAAVAEAAPIAPPPAYHWCPGEFWDPVWGPNWEGGRCHDDFYRDGEPHDQWHWRGGGDRDHWQGGPGDRDWQGGGGDRDHWQGGGGDRDHWQGGGGERDHWQGGHR